MQNHQMAHFVPNRCHTPFLTKTAKGQFWVGAAAAPGRAVGPVIITQIGPGDSNVGFRAYVPGKAAQWPALAPLIGGPLNAGLIQQRAEAPPKFEAFTRSQV